jgi:hypothetical protein
LRHGNVDNSIIHRLHQLRIGVEDLHFW